MVATILLLGTLVALAQLDQAAEYLSTATPAFLTISLLFWARTVSTASRTLIKIGSERDKVKAGYKPILENLVTVAVVITAALIGFRAWGISVTPILASAGILTIFAGLSARNAIANFFGGLFLYYDDTFKIGHYVKIPDGPEGSVIDLSIRSTVLRTRNGTRVTIPNSELNSSTIINESAPKDRKRIDIEVGVEYSSNLDNVETVLFGVANEEPLVVETPEPKARIQEYSSSAIIYEIQCWIESPDYEPEARHRILRSVKQRFDEENITIPFPHRKIINETPSDTTE